MPQTRFSNLIRQIRLVIVKMLSHISKSILFRIEESHNRWYCSWLHVPKVKMPRISIKRRLQFDLHYFCIADFIAAINEDELNETFQHEILFLDLKKQKYLNSIRFFVSKSNWASSVLSNFFDSRFRIYVRMNRFFFKHFADFIRGNIVFQNKFFCAQIPVKNQLKYAFYRLKHDDSSSEFVPSATFWKVSEGLIFKIIKRVVKALCRLKKKYVKWPDIKDRTKKSLINDIKKRGFINVVDKIDGTDIILSTKPGDCYEGELFFNRKKRYAMDLCAVCDVSKKFIYFLIGWPNFQHDQRIFATGK